MSAPIPQNGPPMNLAGERDALLSVAFAKAPFGLVFTTPDGKILDANPAYFSMTGYTREELADRDSAHFTHPGDIALTQRFFASFQDPKQPAGILEKRYLHKDGHIVWVRASATMRYDAAGRPTQLVAIFEDITDRKVNDATLAEKARIATMGADVGAALTKIAALRDSLQECVEAIVKNLDVAFARIWTLEPGEETLQLQASAGMYTHLDGEHARIPVGKFNIGTIALERRAHITNDVPNDPSISDPEWAKREGMVAFAGHPLIIDDRLIGVLGLFSRSHLNEDMLSALASAADIIAMGIKRKRAEDALSRQWQIFDTALSYTPDFTYTFDLDGRFTYVNRALLSLWQKPLSAAVGKNFFDLDYPPELAGRLQRQIQEVIDTKVPLRDETPYTGAAGEQGFYEYIFVPVFDDRGGVAAVVGSTRDITEHVRMKEALVASQQNLQAVFSQAPVAIIVLRGRDYVVELANDPYRAVVQRRELVGHRFFDVVPEVGQDVRDAFDQVMDTGEPFVANEWYVPFDGDGDGETEDHWFNAVYHPRREADGIVSGFIAVLTDVTAQVLARRELERANRELEEFAYVASHDLQEPLRMVNIYTDLLVKRYAANHPDAHTYAAFVTQGVHRMETLIHDLLTYSRIIHPEEEKIGSADLSEALVEAMSVLKDRIQEAGATVTADSLPLVRGEASQLAHVFQNILSNALKYRNTEAPPRIEVTAIKEGAEWVISVRDNGIGFDPQYAERIFGLFKRLHKDEYPGTGLGLAICQRIIERYGGRMWANSQVGEGSTFYFALPCASGLNSQ